MRKNSVSTLSRAGRFHRGLSSLAVVTSHDALTHRRQSSAVRRRGQDR